VGDVKPVLVVVDTLARCMLGVDENSARDVGLVVDGLDLIRRSADGATVLAVHHSGKDGSQGARGSSALRGAVDTELELTASGARLVLKVSKQKDGAEARPLQLDRVSVGDSCALSPAGVVPLEGDDLSDGDLETLEALRRVQVPGGVTANVWRASADLPERTFYNRRARLVNRGAVVNVGTDKRPSYLTADAFEADEKS
jgi:hypothetical protein